MSDPVLVVGAGPTGLTAAFELARLGVAVRLVDKRDGPSDTSRAIGVQARTLELLERRGLAAELLGLGRPTRFGSVHGDGRRLVHVDFGHVDSRYPFMLFVSQAETERVLRAALERLGVSVEWRTELVAFSQDARGRRPAVAVLQGPDGALQKLQAPWLIAADGAHSTLRNTLAVDFAGRSLPTQYALFDAEVDGGPDDAEFHIFAHETGFMALFALGPGHFRIVVADPPGDPDGGVAPSLAELQQAYDRRSHIAARFHDLRWSSWFRIDSRMVPRLKIGRVLLGGDAAHIHSPAGGQGMNTGIQDMVNLSWKLAAVLQGRARPELLDTYAEDRLPVMRNLLSRTERLTDIVGSESPAVQMLFTHLAPLVGGSVTVQDKATAQMAQVALGYRDSPLSEAHGHAGSVQAGDRLPPHRSVRWRQDDGSWAAADVGSLQDPSALVLLVAHGDTDTRLDAAILGASPAMRVVELAPPLDDEAAEAYRHDFGTRSGLMLVRPDGYIALTVGKPDPAPLAAWLRRWFTAPGQGLGNA